jgi:hypothetical protein
MCRLMYCVALPAKVEQSNSCDQRLLGKIGELSLFNGRTQSLPLSNSSGILVSSPETKIVNETNQIWFSLNGGMT